MTEQLNPVYFLSIDPSISSTGLSVLSMHDNNLFVLHYKTSLTTKSNKEFDKTRFKKKFALNSMFIFALDYIEKELNIKPAFAVFEDYSYGSVGHLAHLGELNGMYKCELSKRKIEFDVIAPSSVKKRITGSGKATKEEVAAALSSFVTNYGNFVFNNNDETDSVAVGVAYALNMIEVINESSKDTSQD